MKKLLGLRVTRSGVLGKNKPASFVTWTGFTEEDRTNRAHFIRATIHNPEWDGELTLEPIESDVVVTEPGRYQSSDGRVITVDDIRGTTWHGYWMKKDARGKERWHLAAHGSVNGEIAYTKHTMTRI